MDYLLYSIIALFFLAVIGFIAYVATNLFKTRKQVKAHNALMQERRDRAAAREEEARINRAKNDEIRKTNNQAAAAAREARLREQAREVDRAFTKAAENPFLTVQRPVKAQTGDRATPTTPITPPRMRSRAPEAMRSSSRAHHPSAGNSHYYDANRGMLNNLATAAVVASLLDDNHDHSHTNTPEPVQEQASYTPEPTPTYSAPEPTYDSTQSYSSSNDSSYSSSSSDSSSSWGGDSGGGGDF